MRMLNIIKDKNRKKILSLQYMSILLIVLFTILSAEQYQLSHTLEDYINYALKHNPALRSADHIIEMAKESRKSSTTLPNPSLGLEYMDKMISVKGVTVAKVSFSQKIPWFTKLSARRSVAEKTINKLDHIRNSTEVMVVYSIREAYVSLYTVGRKISYMKRSLEIMKQMESSMLSAYAAAVGSQRGLLKLQVKMAQAEDKIISLRQEGKIIRYRLQELLNTKAALNFPYPAELPELKIYEDISEIKHTALLNNREVLVQKGFLYEAEAKVYEAEQVYFPDFAISTSYASPKFTGIQLVNSGERGEWGAMLSLSLPIWYKSNRAKVNEARKQLAAEREKLKKEESAALREAMVLSVKLNDTERKIKLFRNVIIPKAQQTVKLLREKYTIQKRNIMEFLDSEKILLDLEIDLIDLVKKRELYAADIVIRSLGEY